MDGSNVTCAFVVPAWFHDQVREASTAAFLAPHMVYTLLKDVGQYRPGFGSGGYWACNVRLGEVAGTLYEKNTLKVLVAYDSSNLLWRTWPK